MSQSPDALDQLLASLPSSGAQSKPAPTAPKPATPKPGRGINGIGSTDDYLSVFREKNPDFANVAQGFLDYAKKGGVNDVYIKNGARTADYQNYLHTHGYPTKGNDGYAKISPHQEYRAIDWSTKSPANRAKMHDLLASYAKAHKLHIPVDEPWHMSGAPARSGTRFGSTQAAASPVIAEAPQGDALDELLKSLPAALSVSPSGLQNQPAAPKAPEIPKEALTPSADQSPYSEASPEQVPVYQPPIDDKAYTGNVGRIMQSGPQAEAAYRQFLQRNVAHVKGKAASTDELLKNEALASTFVNLQDYFANNPKAKPHEQARAIAQMGQDWLNDPHTKGQQMPTILHQAMLSAHWTPEEFQALPSALRSQIAQQKARAQASRRARAPQRRYQVAPSETRTAESGGPDEPATPIETQSEFAARMRREPSGVGGLRMIDDPQTQFMKTVESEKNRTVFPGDPSLSSRFKQAGMKDQDIAEFKHQQQEAARTEQAKGIVDFAFQQGSTTQIVNFLPKDAKTWVEETFVKASSQMLATAAGLIKNGVPGIAVARAFGAPDPLLKPSARFLTYTASIMNHATDQIDKTSGRGGASQEIQDLSAGTLGSAPAMALIAVGIPAWAAFGMQSNAQAQGADKKFNDIVRETVKGASIGALFDLPIPAKTAMLTRLGARMGVVGAGTFGLEKLAGTPTKDAAHAAAINAILAGTGEGTGLLKTSAEKLAQSESIPENVRAAAARVAGREPIIARKADSNEYASFFLDPKVAEKEAALTRQAQKMAREGDEAGLAEVQTKIKEMREGHIVTPLDPEDVAARAHRRTVVVPGEVFDQMIGKAEPAPQSGEKITKTITGETEAQDVSPIRGNKGQSTEAAPGVQRPGTEVARGGDIYREGQIGKQVEPGEVAPKGQEEAVQGQAPVEASGVQSVPVSQLNLDPERFQYKIQRDTKGATGSLADVSEWNPNFAGVTAVWRDPADGRDYIVNGHNRFDLAKRTGQTNLDVRYIDAPDAESARAQGALMNIAEGQGTALDAGEFLRGHTPEDLKQQGLNLKRDIVAKGVALSKLSKFLFNQVVQGELPEEYAIQIGNKIESPDLQDQAFKAIKTAEAKGRTLNKGTVDEMIDSLTAAPRQTETEHTLFGDITSERSLVVERAQVAASLKRQLSADKSLFGTAARQSERLKEGGTVVDVEQAKKLQESAAEASGIFDALKNRSGPISDILDEGARQVANGKRADQVAKENYEKIKEAVSGLLGRGKGGTGKADQKAIVRAEEPKGQRSLVEASGKEPAAAGDDLDRLLANLAPDRKSAAASEKPNEKTVLAQKAQQKTPDQSGEVASALKADLEPPRIVADGKKFKVIQPTGSGKAEYGGFKTREAAQAFIDERRLAAPAEDLRVANAKNVTPQKEDVTHGRQTEEVQSKALPPAKGAESEKAAVVNEAKEAAGRSDVRQGSEAPERSGRSTERTFGPGAAAKGDVPQEDPLSQFTAAAQAAIADGNPKTPDDTFRIGEAAAEKWSKTKGSAMKGFAGLRSGVASAVHWWFHPVAPVGDEITARGLWDGNIQRARQNIRTQSKLLTKAVPNRLDRRAIGAYAGAVAAADKAKISPEEILADWASQSTGYTRRVYARAAKLSDAHKTIAKNSLSMMEQMGDYALDPRKMMSQVEGTSGPRSKHDAPPPLLKQLLEDYFPRIVKDANKPEHVLHIQGQLNEFALGKLPTSFKFARQRVFGSEFEGEQHGIVYGDKDFVGRQAAYLNAFYNTFYTRMYLKDLLNSKEADGRPTVTVSGGGTPIVENEPAYKAEVPDIFIVKAGKKPKVSMGTPMPGVEHVEPEKTSDYQFVAHPALKGWRWLGDIGGVPILYEGNLLVHPDKVQAFRSMLGKSWWQQHAATRWGLQALGTAKSIVVAGGLFHPVQTGLRGAVRGVVPIKDYNPFALETPDFKDPDTWLLARTGTLFADNHALARFAEGVGTSGIVNKIPVIGTHILHPLSEWTFLEYIPAMKNTLGKKWLAANRKRYPNLSEDQVGQLTSRQVNATFGLQNVRYIARHPSTQDFLRTISFAPDWNESKLKSYGQALRPYGRNQMFGFLKMAFGMWILGRILNKLTDDDYHFDTPFTVVYNGREYGLKSDVTDFQMMVTNPRMWAMHRMNFFTSGAMEIATRTDDRGQRVDFTQAIGDIIKSVQPIALGRRRPGEQWWEGPLNSTGVTNYKHYTAAERILVDYLNDKPRVRSSPDERHQLIRELKDKSKKGSVEPEISDALEKGKLTLADTRQIRDDEKMSDFALMTKHVPLEVALNAFEKADDKQKGDAKLEMALKLQGAKPEVFTDEMRARLEKDGFTIPKKIGSTRKVSETRRESQKERKETKAVKRWLAPADRPVIQKRRYQVTPR